MQRDSWRKGETDYRDSLLAFDRYVWPEISPLIGGGAFVHTTYRSEVDLKFGVDGYQRFADGRKQPVAFRIQWSPADMALRLGSYSTFTIRSVRPNATTELDKLLVAAASNQTRPYWTIQGYMLGPRASTSFIDAAAVRTDDLIKFVSDNLAAIKTRIKANKDGSSSFVNITWAELASAGICVHQASAVGYVFAKGSA